MSALTTCPVQGGGGGRNRGAWRRGGGWGSGRGRRPPRRRCRNHRDAFASVRFARLVRPPASARAAGGAATAGWVSAAALKRLDETRGAHGTHEIGTFHEYRGAHGTHEIGTFHGSCGTEYRLRPSPWVREWDGQIPLRAPPTPAAPHFTLLRRLWPLFSREARR